MGVSPRPSYQYHGAFSPLSMNWAGSEGFFSYIGNKICPLKASA